MKNQWVTFINGKVVVKIEGRVMEPALNALLKAGIPVWDVKRKTAESITFQIAFSDVHKLRHAVRPFDCRVSFLKGEGGPFLLKRIWKNSGFLAGALAFFAIIFVLSNMIWGIEIKGASPEVEHQMRKELKSLGLSTGKTQFTVPDVETIQRELSYRMDNITWVGVDLKGTTFHFQVVEKNAPEPGEATGAQHLVAGKKAVIVRMFVEEGDPKVAVTDYVEKGQLLVSGLIGTEDKPKGVPAKGEVFGETWYKTSVDLPLQSTFSVFTGNEKRHFHVGISDWKLPVWGFGDPEYKESVKEENTKRLRFLKWEIPIAITDTSIKEKEVVDRKYTKKEALAEARKLARNNLLSQLPDDAEIKGEKILHEKFENGKVRVTIHFKVVENIAVGQPLIQGD